LAIFATDNCPPFETTGASVCCFCCCCTFKSEWVLTRVSFGYPKILREYCTRTPPVEKIAGYTYPHRGRTMMTLISCQRRTQYCTNDDLSVLGYCSSVSWCMDATHSISRRWLAEDIPISPHREKGMKPKGVD
jgi:hypothetical protein